MGAGCRAVCRGPAGGGGVHRGYIVAMARERLQPFKKISFVGYRV